MMIFKPGHSERGRKARQGRANERERNRSHHTSTRCIYILLLLVGRGKRLEEQVGGGDHNFGWDELAWDGWMEHGIW
jgi:hypothetical protein